MQRQCAHDGPHRRGGHRRTEYRGQLHASATEPAEQPLARNFQNQKFEIVAQIERKALHAIADRDIAVGEFLRALAPLDAAPSALVKDDEQRLIALADAGARW